MKLLLFILLCACAAVTAQHRPPRIELPREAVTLDPLTTDAATVDDLHHAGKDAICTASTLDLVQLCRDKGFDGVTISPAADALVEKARRLKLRVVDNEGKRTTTGS